MSLSRNALSKLICRQAVEGESQDVKPRGHPRNPDSPRTRENRRRAGPPASPRSGGPGPRDAASCAATGRRARTRSATSPTSVERFGRRGTEPNELLRSEFGQNSFKIQEFSSENLRKSMNFNSFYHFLEYWRNSDKISSKSEQKSPKTLKKRFLQNFAEKCEKV